LQVKHEVVDLGNSTAVIKGTRVYFVTPEDDEDTQRKKAAKRYIRAHQSVKQDWTRHDDSCPDGVRERVWTDPFYTPSAFASEQERRFVEIRRMRRRRAETREGYTSGDDA
jgi:hypothetical protein